ncbi:ddi1p [Saccharomyces arboricola H-6]|uniref:DNA damage-inducible protein 1 n=1 Tax=Saccharomyces arboricola (strain H-6 / AS 2.3317 / CBS 10644) TaxID=1160507 RepID=J8Q5P4_SACAR|nr:ddi1p [Saccharomyces arboricola H-6]
MDLTISNELTGEIYGPIEVSEDMALTDLIALLQADCGFDRTKHDLYFNMDILDSSKTQSLKELGIKTDDLLLIRGKISDSGQADADTLSDEAFIEQFRQELLSNQMLRSQLTLQIPGLNDLINDHQMFKERLGPLILQRRYGAYNTAMNPFGIPQDEYNRLMANPDDPDNKKRIAELVDQQAIDEQLRNAIEYTPEVFTQVPMLYINIEINNFPVKAFVDTGAQTTIMSTRLAEKTDLTKMIDKRFIGEARGVGTGKIIGRIHQAQVKIETQYIPCSFTVLDTDIDVLIGLDMLKRHLACVDLKDNVLRIAEVETKFLSEAEIPKGFEGELPAPTSVASSSSKPVVPTKTSSSLKPQPGAVPALAPRTSTVPTPTGRTTATRTFPEPTIKQLMDLGFPRDAVVKALKQTNGNAEFAASLLFQ